MLAALARRAPSALALALVVMPGCSSVPLIPEVPAEKIEYWSLAATPLDRSAAQLTLSNAMHLEAIERLYEEILAVEGRRTPENTLVLLSELYMHFDAASSEAGLFAAVHADEAMRDAATEAGVVLSARGSELGLDRALYEAIVAIDLSEADEATRFAVEKELQDYRRAGIDQPADVQEKLKALNAELVELGQTFNRNNAEAKLEITLDSVDQLAGLPADYIAAHAPGEDGKIVINTTYPDYRPVLKYAEDGEVRRRLYMQYANRAWPENGEVLDGLIAKRHEKALLLGYDSWADYVTEDKMIASAANAGAFIERVATSAREAAVVEVGVLLERKRQDDPDASRVEAWESGYYSNLVRKEQFDFDSQALRPYFEFERVRQGIFDINSRLYGVEFRQVLGLNLWHDSVSAWDLFDGDVQLGRFYLDLFPRDNKYGHAACFGYRDGVDGWRLPQATLVCNFPDPGATADGVALMEYGEVRTFFHEFGHLMHSMFAGHRRWMMNTGISTEWDFVEAPSQMLEEWMLDVDTLQLFAKHYKTGEALSVELIEKLRSSSEFGKAMNVAGQMFYAALSFNCYSRDPFELDTTLLVKELQAKYSPLPFVRGTHMQASFGHLNGYSAIYYTYMWSKVIAKDMATRFQSEGFLNSQTADDYRRRVLEAGGSRPAAELVKDFLGRSYDFAAFEAWLSPDA
ncbi:MAG: thimet oligopeptidase [Pseudohongiellaceae bacterium]|jgi:thimet oligopeptidase